IFSSPATLAALSLSITSKRPKRAVAIVIAAWLIASIALGAAYPHPFVRGESYGRILIAADLLGLFVSFGALSTWGLRHEPPRPPLLGTLTLLFVDLAILINPYSPWHGPVFGGRYEVAQLMQILLFITMAIGQGVLWKSSAR